MAQEVLAGVTHPIWAWVSHQADRLAGQASKSRLPPQDVINQTENRVHIARAVQGAIAGAAALKVHMPPRVDRTAGFSHNELKRRHEWVASLARNTKNFELLHNMFEHPALHILPVYQEATQDSMRLSQVSEVISQLEAEIVGTDPETAPDSTTPPTPTPTPISDRLIHHTTLHHSTPANITSSLHSDSSGPSRGFVAPFT